MNELLDLIANYDYFGEMSDSHAIWQKQKDSKLAIEQGLSKYYKDNQQKIDDCFNMYWVNPRYISWQKYFKYV